MRTLGIIVARGSSKRLPRKNVLDLLGAPLLSYMCRAALRANLTKVIVSTEDDEIASVANCYGVETPFRRPDELASDWARSEDIVLHAVDWMAEHTAETYDIVVLMQPTTPFVQAEQIAACVAALDQPHVACCFTAVAAEKPPEWMFTLDDDSNALNYLNQAIAGDKEHSQLIDKKYVPTGAAYAVRVEEVRTQQRILCDPARMTIVEPQFAIDIDTEVDLKIAEAVGQHYQFSPPSPIDTTGSQ